MNNALSSCVDWISFTFHPTYSFLECLKLLNISTFELDFTGHGSSGYAKLYKHVSESISILTDGNEDMGVHVDCTGRSVTWLLSHALYSYGSTPFGSAKEVLEFGQSDLNHFFTLMCKYAKFTRIDLAIDDTAGYYDFPELYQVQKDLSYITLSKSWENIVTRDSSSGVITGQTIYLGSRKSDTLLRVYDKALEQKAKGVTVPFDSWVRWELELKHDNADGVARILADHPVGSVAFDVLNKYLRIIDLTTSSRKCRCKNAKKWDKFIGAVQRVRLKQKLESNNLIEKKRDWMMSAVSKSMAMVIAADCGDDALIYDMLAYGKSKLRNRDIDIINHVAN